MEDEDTLELSIREYEFQVSQIEAAIGFADEAGRVDLVKLQRDLNQLIQLTKDSLLSVKKKRMLQEVDRLLDQPGSNSIPEVSQAPSTSGVTPAIEASISSIQVTQEPDEDLQKLLESLEGTKCQAPFGHEWGQSGYHNALVLSVESSDSIESVQDIQVKVLFCNPLFNAMKPCTHFLEGSCRFSDEECHFSHGHPVSFGNVRQFCDPDYSLLRRDATCLAKFKDGLWYPAVVDSVSEDHQVTVQYIQYKTIAEVPLEDVLPTDNLDSDTSSDDDDDDETSALAALDDSDGVLDDDLPAVGLLSTTPTSQMLGEWEKHTRGIGSKLMEKMGYVLGMGLGKNCDGRLEPVEAILLPQGKSLDKIMEMKERAGNRDLANVVKKSKRKHRKKQKKIAQGYFQPEGKSVFNFINKKLGNISDSRTNSPQPSINPKKELKTATAKTLNTQCFQVSEDIRKAEQELTRLNNALSRNAMRDRLVAGQIKQKITEHEALIKQLKGYEKAISGEQNTRKNDKKLAIF